MDDMSPVDGVACAECGRAPEGNDSLEAEGWRYFPAGAEYAHLFCPECAEREFGPPV
jgi:hypothetical protein